MFILSIIQNGPRETERARERERERERKREREIERKRACDATSLP